MRRHGRVRRVLREGHHPGEQFVENAAQRVDVDAVVQSAGLDLLRCGVGEGGEHVAGTGELAGLIHCLGDTEVGEQHALGLFGIVAVGEQDVGRFDVAMPQPVPVREVQARAHLADDPQHPVDRHGRRRALQGLGGVDAVDVLHVDPQLLVGAAAVVHGHDVAVIQPGSQVGLPLEARPEAGVRGQVGAQQLQRILARQPGVVGQIDGAHPAGAQHAFDRESGEHRPRSVCHACLPSRSQTVIIGQADCR